MKKLLGLLAVAPMAIAACGGSKVDTTKDGIAYGATHGLEIVTGDKTIGFADEANTTLHTVALADLSVDTCGDVTTAADLAIVEAAAGTGNWNSFDISGTVSLTVNGGDNTLCDVPSDGVITYATNSKTMVTSGLTKAEVTIDADGKLETIVLDETSRVAGTGDNAGRNVYTVEEVYNSSTMDEYGFRLLTQTEADDFISEFEKVIDDKTAWKHGTDYMPTDTDGDGTKDEPQGWTKSIDAIVAYFKGATLAEAKTKLTALETGTDTDWADASTGASVNFKHGYHYAAVLLEAFEELSA